MDAPNFFGIIFEKHLVKRATKPVDHKILERHLLLSPENLGRYIPYTCNNGIYQAQIGDGLVFQGNRVIKKLPEVKNP